MLRGFLPHFSADRRRHGRRLRLPRAEEHRLADRSFSRHGAPTESPGAGASSDFFADQRGARVPVAGTVPIGYEMPQASSDEGTAVDQQGEMTMQPRLGFSGGTDYYNTGKMGANWGTGFRSK